MPVSSKPPKAKAVAKAPKRAVPKTPRPRVRLAATDPADALYEAQQLIYDAWQKTAVRSRASLAKKALALSPLCADAYNLLAADAKTPNEAKTLYERGVETGALALGPTGFEDYSGGFWGFLETRPYMRARHGLALTLMALGEDQAAFDHLREMLELNPNDNQGLRYLLLAGLMRHGDEAAAKALLAAYEDEWSANWLYARVLLAFRDGDGGKPKTRKLLDDARSANGHVPGILAGSEPMVGIRGELISVGGRDEATDYVREFGDAWRKTPGAIDWLVGTLGSAPSKRRAARRLD